jgi:hypothetical protein
MHPPTTAVSLKAQTPNRCICYPHPRNRLIDSQVIYEMGCRQGHQI